MDVYSPATIGPADLEALMGRLDRYLDRHGSLYGETPIPPDCRDDVRQSIIADWWGDDWGAREFAYLASRGRNLFGPDLSELGRHLRALLFHAGRARKRRWRAEGAKRGEEARRRGMEDFSGAGSASRAADPALTVAAVESASGALVLSKSAALERSRRRLPLKYRGGLSAVPDDAPKAFRWMKRRNAKGVDLVVVARHDDRTEIEFRPWVRFNFERVGSVPHRIEWTDDAGQRRSSPNPARAPSRRKLPAGVDAAGLREALTG